MFQLTIWSLPPLLTTFLAVAAFRRVNSRSSVPGTHALKFLFAALTFWSAGQTFGTLVTTEYLKLLIGQMNYIGITLTPVAWCLFALTYTQRIFRMSQRTLNLLCIVPLTTVILAFTNTYHGLIWLSWELVTFNGYVGLVTEHGDWFYVNAIYSYALIVVSTGILTFALAQAKQHAQTLLTAIAAPTFVAAANLIYLSPAYPFPFFDLTTLGFLLAVIVLDRGILQAGFLNRSPVVRERVVEYLKDPVIVVTHNGAIVDANQSALSTWVLPTGTLLHANVDRLVKSLPLETLRDSKGNSEVTIGELAFEVSATPLDQTNPQSDVALVFRDVTARRQADLELRTLKDELERMAHTDALTNMYNRRYFMQRLNEEFERVRRHGSILSVLVFDLDHFKLVNDTYGHDVGDAVLIAVSEVVEEIKRATDVGCRLGGEEFALLLPETDRTGAVNLAHRIRKGIANYPLRKILRTQTSSYR